jgi:hypothetical protein
MRLVFDAAGLNVNYVRLTPETGGGGMPYGGTPWPLPGTIQVEDFDEGGEGIAYHDHSSPNSGGQYRQTGVDIERTADTGGGYNAGWVGAGEWLAYTVDVAAAGTYSLTIRVASPAAGGSFHVEFDGIDRTGTLQVPATGGWQAWRDVSTTVTLPAGVQTMRVVFDTYASSGAVGNFNYVRLR